MSSPRGPRRRPRRTTVAGSSGSQVVPPDELRRYAGAGARWRAGNDVHVLRGGRETFPAMLHAIAEARREIVLETYILVDDATGTRFAAALAERARAGVTVRLMYDAIGGFGLSASFLDGLRDAGVQVLDYHPVAPWRRRWNVVQRDHRKILVVDDAIAFVGGINIGDDYAAPEDGGHGWHDMHCSLHGPIVRDLARLVRRLWIQEGGAYYHAPPAAELVSPDDIGGGTAYVHMLENGRRRQRRSIRRAYLRVFAAAQRSIVIKNAYFLPDRRTRGALARAVARGVAVDVIVPGRSDVRMIEWATLYVARRMHATGVRVHRWRGTMMHAKTAAIDGVWSTIGSYNLDIRSLRFNLEVTVEILDHATARELEQQFHDDLDTNAVLFDDGVWRAQPWWRKALAWVAYRFRRWL